MPSREMCARFTDKVINAYAVDRGKIVRAE